MKIKNLAELAGTEARRVALEVAEAGLQAIDTEQIIRKTVSLSGDLLVIDGEEIQLKDVGRIIVAGVGKCAARAAKELENILGDRLAGGLVITIGEVPPFEKIKHYPGTHPFPSKENMEASRALVASLSGLEKNDLVIFIATGGGSTLLCLPDDGDWQRESLVFEALMNFGAPIQDINTVRKHMSRARGGFLAAAMYPAQVISLVFNDVPGSDDLGFIASGPTVKDVTTVSEARAILDKYSLDGYELLETPKEDKYFERVKNVVVVSNKTALLAMKRAAEEKGYQAEIAGTKLAGEAHDVGRALVELTAKAAPRTVLLWGGETTVTIHKPGKGGRNQELAIGALMALPDGADGTLLMAVASDGRDNSDIGGAFCDKMIKDKAREIGADPQEALDANQSYGFWRSIGEYLNIGETGSNVSDLIIGVKTS